MKKIILILFILAVFPLFTFSQPFFQKITTGPIVSDVSSNSQCAWADYDNDGDQDLVIMPWNDHCWTCYYPILMFKNLGNGTFEKVTNNAITQQIINATGVAWGDYDNDGKLDLFIARVFNFNNLLFHNVGGGVFTQILTGSIVNDGGQSTGCSWVDYDRDGWLDLYVNNNFDQNNFLYHNNGNATFTRITTGNIVNDGGYSRGCSWGDYDNDGWPDLFVVNYQGQHDFLYHNNHNGTFTRIYNGPEVNDIDWGSTCKWADYDNDGFLDLFVTNNNTSNKLYHNEGNSNFTLSYTLPSNEGGENYSCCWGDYNNDGWIDLFVPKHGANNILYKNTFGSFVKVDDEIVVYEGGYSDAGTWADYNNDGKLDLIVTNTYGNTRNYQYKNVGTSGNYLICKLKGGCSSNKAAIGARIKLYDGTFFEMREVNGGTSSQNMLWQHFGLGNITNVDSIVVLWPSGKRQKLTNVSANQIITIDECTIGIISNQIPVKYELLQNYPNPFNPVTAIEYSLMKTTNVLLIIYDVNGREVETLVNKKQNQGKYREIFDGSKLSSGVYIYKLVTDEFNSTKKMVLLK